MSFDKNNLDDTAILGYLNDLLDRIRRLQIISSEGRAAFMDSFILQDAAIRSFEVIGEIVKRLPQELFDSYADIPWRSFARFTDVFNQDHTRSELDTVWNTTEDYMQFMRNTVQQMIADKSTSA